MEIKEWFWKILGMLTTIFRRLFDTFKNWLYSLKNTKNCSENSSEGFFKRSNLGITKFFEKLPMQFIKIATKKLPLLFIKLMWFLLKTLNKISKKLFGKIKCELGQHVADYANTKGDPKCFLSGVCLNCGEKHIKYQHEFPDLWTREGDCIEVKYCNHCKEAKQTRSTHIYTESVDEECNVIGICKNCGHEKKMDAKQHEWKIIENINEKGERREQYECVRCGRMK